MAKKYCKKSSMQAVANEVKTRKGSSSNIQGSSVASDIGNLVIPTQRGAPTTTLTASNQSATVQRGKYTGGSVLVVQQNATATLSQNGGYVPIEDGKTLASVKVPAVNLYRVVTGEITPANNSTSLSLPMESSITPKGFVAIMVTASGGVGTPYIGGIAYDGTTVYGVAAGSSASNGCPITSASVSKSAGNITVSNIVATDGSAFSATFKNNKYVYAVWG